MSEDRTATEVRTDIRTYEKARPQLVRDVEDAARLAQEDRARLIRGEGSLSPQKS